MIHGRGRVNLAKLISAKLVCSLVSSLDFCICLSAMDTSSTFSKTYIGRLDKPETSFGQTNSVTYSKGSQYSIELKQQRYVHTLACSQTCSIIIITIPAC